MAMPTKAKPKITAEQIEVITDDFAQLIQDVLTIVPHSPQVDMAVMMFRMAEAAVLTVLKQYQV